MTGATATTSGVEFVRAARRVRSELGQEHRFAHVLRVARFAERLAVAHGEDSSKARLAGLFHDLARLYSAQQLIAQCTQRSMPIDDFERANPIVLHARLGAEIARERFGVDDEAILAAIRKHTVPAARMSRLDIILYLADGLEPGRDYPERSAYAALAFRDLHGAMHTVIGATIAYLRRRALPIAPQMFAAQKAFTAPPGASVSDERHETVIIEPGRTRARF